MGDPLEVLHLYPGGASEVRLIGSDLAAGMHPQLFIPAGTFHAGRVQDRAGYALLGTSVWLRAEQADVEIGHPEGLMAAY